MILFVIIVAAVFLAIVIYNTHSTETNEQLLLAAARRPPRKPPSAKAGYLILAGVMLGMLAVAAVAWATGATAAELPVPEHAPTHAHAAPSQVVHNGSLMDVTMLGGGHVVMRYAVPAPWLAGLVAPGTVLIDGWWSRGYLNATAFVFTGCGAFPYAVGGSVDQAGELVLAGPAPIIFDDCFVGGYSWESGNARLVFNHTGGK